MQKPLERAVAGQTAMGLAATGLAFAALWDWPPWDGVPQSSQCYIRPTTVPLQRIVLTSMCALARQAEIDNVMQSFITMNRVRAQQPPSPPCMHAPRTDYLSDRGTDVACFSVRPQVWESSKWELRQQVA